MSDLTLVIGNKNYSSWSLRPWLALKAAGRAFDEVLIVLRRPETKAEILLHSAAGKLPVLKHGDLTIWESLAICEYIAATWPEAGLLPEDARACAVARSVMSEMHAGFVALRRELPMDINKLSPLAQNGVMPGEEARLDIARVQQIWQDCRGRFGRKGDFLFGRFGIADAMYAPVATRLRSYGVAMDPVSEAYVNAIYAFPAMQEWCAAAAKEQPLPEN
ncbi:glutathione S-transferase family protein [Ferrovibrio terrae]|uniref:Glutathione S-transferase family protein n=1 Tax=Ferrovibrio terrae TaxID=2594003 RepID=A0A516H2Q8_9PROT|nr:glutathione S-transferase family protein [Ferrovibrio terrae]QDO98049.1 glutathione S-transferase family protein [Ferrovibrio terrae]